jgi:hypothetical protein
VIVPVSARRGLSVLVGAGGRSGAGGQRADRVKHGDEVDLPRPAGGESECPLAAGAGQSGGDLQQLASAGSGGLDGPVRLSDLGGPASEVVRQGGDHRPGASGVHLPRGEMR